MTLPTDAEVERLARRRGWTRMNGASISDRKCGSLKPPAAHTSRGSGQMPKNIRPIRIDGKIAYVPLTQGYEAVIDAADVPLVDGRNWYAVTDGNTSYAVRADRSKHKQRIVSIHRVILGEPEGLDVDHVDGNGLDNRRANLRVATRSQNQWNQRLRIDNTSGYKGVHWDKAEGKWKARIRLNGTRISLGYYGTLDAAHEAYAKASAQLHGEFGRIV